MRHLLLSLLPLFIAVGCGDKDDDTAGGSCSTDEVQCTDADVLQTCVDGAWEDTEDCAEQGLMCHEEMGHCMEMDDGK